MVSAGVRTVYQQARSQLVVFGGGGGLWHNLLKLRKIIRARINFHAYISPIFEKTYQPIEDMKKVIFMALAAVMVASGANAQVTNGKMIATSRGFFMDEKRITVTQAKNYSRQFPEAMKHIRTGQAVCGVAFVAALCGEYIVAYQLGGAISGKGVNAGALAAGVVVWGGAFGLIAFTNGQYKKAAAAYNSATGLAGLPKRDITLALVPTHGGLGLQLKF